MITLIIFAFFSFLALLSAILVIVRKNIMHSVLYLAFAVLATSGIFFSLQAEYLGAIQVLVYAGGIVVLYIFVIIIVNLHEMQTEKRKLFPKFFIYGMPILLMGEIIWAFLKNQITFAAGDPKGLEVKPLAEMLLSTYIIPFEIASVLLLAVLIGAIIVARRKLLHDTN